MKTFSMSAAIAEPFRLAFKRPLMTLVWGLVLLLPAVIVVGAMLPFFGEMIASGAFEPEASVGETDPDFSPAAFASMIQFQLWNILANLIQVVGAIMVTAASIRAVFAGRRGDATAFLRLGMGEVYVALMAVIAFIIATFAAVALVVVGIGVAFGLAQVGDPWRWLIGTGLFIAAGVAFLLLWGRLSLLAPASVRYKRFAFEEGWRLGAGQTWKLLGLMLMMCLVAIAVSIVLIVGFIVVIAVVGGGFHIFADPDLLVDEAAVEGWFEQQMMHPWPLIAAGLALLIPVAWIQGFSQVLFTAPYARAVMELSAEVAPAPEASISADIAPASE